MAIGSLLVYQQFKMSLASKVGFSLLVLAGIGTILVGSFPENHIGILHGIGSILGILIGDLGILVLGISLNLPRPIRFYTILTGVIATSAFLMFASHIYLGLGIGGMERVAGHFQTLWLIIFGAHLLKKHLKAGV
jgi:hypothetical membrane protein